MDGLFLQMPKEVFNTCLLRTDYQDEMRDEEESRMNEPARPTDRKEKRLSHRYTTDKKTGSESK